MTDPILEKLERLEEYVRLLAGLRGRDLEDPYLKGALERYLQLAAESALDAGEMLIARERLPRPGTYRGVIQALARAGILDVEFAREFEGIAGLRNLLVHDYARVELRALVPLLGRLDDFRVYARALATRIAKGGA